jgi:hypothetical protein
MPGGHGRFTTKGSQTLRVPDGVTQFTLGTGAP